MPKTSLNWNNRKKRPSTMNFFLLVTFSLPIPSCPTIPVSMTRSYSNLPCARLQLDVTHVYEKRIRNTSEIQIRMEQDQSGDASPSFIQLRQRLSTYGSRHVAQFRVRGRTPRASSPRAERRRSGCRTQMQSPHENCDTGITSTRRLTFGLGWCRSSGQSYNN